MGRQNQTTVKLPKGEKPAIKAAQETLEEETGIRPNQGEAIVIACKRLAGVEA